MKRTFLALLTASSLISCTGGPRTGDGLFRSQRESPPPAKEAVNLSSSQAIEDSRPPPRADEQWPQDDDGLSLKPTELHRDLGIGDREFRIDQQSALSGDKDAAVRIARMFQRGSNAVPRDERRGVLWLRRASDLKHGSASYELYLYYLGLGQDREALRYEKRALEQGFTPPPRLDPRRG